MSVCNGPLLKTFSKAFSTYRKRIKSRGENQRGLPSNAACDRYAGLCSARTDTTAFQGSPFFCDQAAILGNARDFEADLPLLDGVADCPLNWGERSPALFDFQQDDL